MWIADLRALLGSVRFDRQVRRRRVRGRDLLLRPSRLQR
jgi:hypothetical protein